MNPDSLSFDISEDVLQLGGTRKLFDHAELKQSI